ncbi:MAG: hypothetical protein AAGC68_14845 [Verrucomicrobiota bacterium]
MKASEKRLLFILLCLVGLGGLVVISDLYFEKRDQLLAERNRLELDWGQIEALFEEKDYWEIRANWLKQNQPAFTSAEAISQAIFNVALAEDRDEITTSKQTLLPVEETDHYLQAGVSLTATGPLPSIFRWFYDLTQPESFRAIRNLKLNPDKEDPEQVIAQFELLRWYAPPNT